MQDVLPNFVTEDEYVLCSQVLKTFFVVPSWLKSRKDGWCESTPHSPPDWYLRPFHTEIEGPSPELSLKIERLPPELSSKTRGITP